MLPWTRRRPRGRRRLMLTRAQLRAWCHRVERTSDRLARTLIVRTLERDGARAERDDARAAIAAAVLRIAALEEQVRDAVHLRGDNVALRSRLANLTAVRPLTTVQSAPDEETVPTDMRRLRTPRTHVTYPTGEGWRVVAMHGHDVGPTHITATTGRQR